MFIAQILQSKHQATCKWCPRLRHCYNLSTQSFAHFPKRHFEFTKLAQILQTKGDKILCNVKTHWTSMLSPIKHVMSKYKTLMLKIVKDNMEVVIAKTNFELLCDVSLPLALVCLQSFFEIAHAFIKFFQKRNVFACHYVATITICQSQLYLLYNDPNTCYISNAFKYFKDLVASKHDIVGLCWVVEALDLKASNVEYLAFHFTNHTFLAIYVDPFFLNFN
jgi:hypothetical protein